MAYRFTLPGQVKELRRSFVREIAPDVFMLEGYISDYFLLKPASSNIFLLRDEDTLVMLDTGLYPFYRERVLELMRKFRRDGAKRLVLLLTQGHFDHAGNIDIIRESGFSQWSFLLPEPEREVLDFLPNFMEDFQALDQMYDIFQPFEYSGPLAVVKLASRINHNLALSLLKQHFRIFFSGIDNMAGELTPLRLEEKVTRSFGGVELDGWELGRLFLIHDASHTPGHISLYDAENRLLISGDVTVEINPAFYYSSLDRCIEACGRFRSMAEAGYVELATDSHRSPTFLPQVFEKFGFDPLHPVQVGDVARGKEECSAFFRMFEDYYSRLREGVLEAHSRLGESTVPQIVEEMGGMEDPYIKMKRAMKFWRLPSRMDVLVAVVLREVGARWRREGGEVLFLPAKS